MPGLPVFVDEQDAKILLRWLSDDQDIAFIVPTGPRQWKAVPAVSELEDGNYSLWYVPSGPLPLLGGDDPNAIIANPWQGWTDLRPSADSTTAYFGAGHLGEIRLSLQTRHRPYSQQERSELRLLNGLLLGSKDLMSVSDFQWIGNRHQPAPKQMHQWWRRLKRWIEPEAIRVRPYTAISGTYERWSFWAFPSAFQKLSNGMDYYAYGCDLTNDLSAAQGKVT